MLCCIVQVKEHLIIADEELNIFNDGAVLTRQHPVKSSSARLFVNDPLHRSRLSRRSLLLPPLPCYRSCNVNKWF